MLVDTHQHLVYPDKVEYPWLESVPDLRRATSLNDYWEDADRHDIGRTLFMEVDAREDQQLLEVEWIASLARDSSSRIAGIVASGRPEHLGFTQHLDRLMDFPVRGLRRVLHVVPDAVSQDSRFRENLRLLAERRLSFDICMQSRQLPLAADLAKSCPEVTFVLDHCGNPDIANGEWDSWKSSMSRLPKLPNVNCKLSGIAVNCGDVSVTPDTLNPYLNTCLDLFGVDRLLFGSDWPVCRLSTTLHNWVEIFTDWSKQSLNEEERTKVHSSNAENIYNLPAT